MDIQESRENSLALARRFLSSVAEYESDKYNETEVRNDFINPLFMNLGWDVLNTKGLPPYLREVKHEATVRVQEGDSKRKKKPDYSFRLGKEVKFYVEAKKPHVDVVNNREAALQIRKYGWNGNVHVSILTNFEQIVVYDCTIPPGEDDQPHVARIATYDIRNMDEWIDKFITDFSRESVVSGHFDEIFEKPDKNPMRKPFDIFFLEQIQTWRNNLGKAIVEKNPDVSSDTLNIAVQRILNRVLFLRSCEDREIEEYEPLKKITTFEELSAIFSNADRKYDSGLFEYISSLEFRVPDDVLISIFRDLYYPNSPYDFDMIDPFIIGQIYELFLTERMENKGGVFSVAPTEELKESLGIATTPRPIVDRIVDEVLSYDNPESFAEDELDVRMADICCGSGIFLLSSFESLQERRLDVLTKPENIQSSLRSKRIVDTDGEGNYELSFIEKRNILTNCIFGVDIDELAVEVSKFSLLLHLLDGCDPYEIEASCKSLGIKVLPNLDRNIKVGNSLIDGSYRKFNPDIDTDPELMVRIKMFDWDKEFDLPFTHIVGNPPYVRVQKMVKFSKSEYEFYRNPISKYNTSKAITPDEYYLFIERALSLIQDTGSVGMIVSNKFMKIKSGTPLREVLSAKRIVRKIVDFGINPVFSGKSNYTCLLFLNKHGEDVDYIPIDDMTSFFDGSADAVIVPRDRLTSEPWTFDELDLIIAGASDRTVPLKSICDVYVGLQTSADKIYIIDVVRTDSEYAYFIDRGKTRAIERSILRPCIYDATITKYHRVQPNRWMIFPYSIMNGVATLYNEEQMKRDYPKAYEYLFENYEALSNRSINGKDPVWYAFGRTQSLTKFNRTECLIWPVLSIGGNYVYETDGTAFTGGGNGPYYALRPKANTSESILYIQAVLNWDHTESIVKSKASEFRGAFYSHGKLYVENLPIYKIDFSNDREKRIYDAIVSKVKDMMQLADRIDREPLPSNKQLYEASMMAMEGEIDRMLEDLYTGGKACR